MSHDAAMHDQVSPLRRVLNTLLFDLSSRSGMIFNFVVQVIILMVVLASMANTVPAVNAVWGYQIEIVELWVLVLFSVEYALRLYSAHHRWRYMRSFNGIVDLMTIMPLFLGIESQVAIRLLRVARVMKMALSIPILHALMGSLSGSLKTLFAVLLSIGLISILVGNLVYMVEPETYTNAFEGAWWSQVTMSTVGYGDFVPHSPIGKVVATLLILTGICMFAMVTAVISAKVGRMLHYSASCNFCGISIAPDYRYCPHCATNQYPMISEQNKDPEGLQKPFCGCGNSFQPSVFAMLGRVRLRRSQS